MPPTLDLILPNGCKGTSYLRFFLPVADAAEPEETRSLTILPESRPEFYDFDLFGNVQHVPELEDRPLTDLTYTVFDMETTGLNPAEGDEIISIGAFRIVNCRCCGKSGLNSWLIRSARSPGPRSKSTGSIPKC